MHGQFHSNSSDATHQMTKKRRRFRLFSTQGEQRICIQILWSLPSLPTKKYEQNRNRRTYVHSLFEQLDRRRQNPIKRVMLIAESKIKIPRLVFISAGELGSSLSI